MVVVTASPQFAIERAIGAMVSAVVGTVFEQVDGHYTGATVGASCFGSDMVDRLSQWARDNGLGLDIEACFGDDPSVVHYMVLGRNRFWFVEPSHKEVILS